MYTLKEWEITDTWSPSSDDVLPNGNRLMTGNGYLGHRGVVDESEAKDMPATIIAGLYDRQGDLWREPVNAPDPVYLLLSVEGAPLRAGDTNTQSHEQSLNYQYGVYSRATKWQMASGIISLRTERFAHMGDVHLLCAHYTISADKDCTIEIKQGINRAVRDLNGPHLGAFQYKKSGPPMGGTKLGLSCATLEKKIPLSVYSVLAGALGSPREGTEGEEGIFSHYTLALKANVEYEFFVYGTIFSALETGGADPGAPAEALADKAATEGWGSLLARHRAEWDKIWRVGDVVIEGDTYAQNCLRYSLYHLWIIAPRETVPAPHGAAHGAVAPRALSIPARGLSGQTYKGAVFWDTEMFISPYFLAVCPDLAAEFIRYRIQTLPGAKRKAAEYGFRGAFFAWESQEDGDDACSDFNVTDVFTGRPVRTFFRDKQIHISGDVVYSIKKYIDATGDFSILTDGAMELICEVARFYLSYMYYSPDHGRYELLDVIGPDEYHERVNNNAFTNRLAFLVFEASLEYIEYINSQNGPAFIESLFQRIDFIDDFNRMKTVMKQLYVPSPDNRGIIEQFDGYFRLEDCSLETVRSRLKDPKEYWGGCNGVAYPTQIIKQADVITLLALFDGYSDEVKKANIDYYEPRTEHGSSLSSCMYALVSCQIGNSDWAYPFFIKSAEIDITGKSKHFAGLVYIGGTHPAANGGAWLTAIHGFCGFSVKDGTINITPRLPRQWNKVTFTAIVKGVEYEITVTREDYSVCRK